FGAVFTQPFEFNGLANQPALPRRMKSLHTETMHLAITYRHQNFYRLLYNLILGISKHAFGAVVPKGDLPAVVRQDNGIGCRLDHRTKTDLGGANFVLLPLQFTESLRLLDGIPNQAFQQRRRELILYKEIDC